MSTCVRIHTTHMFAGLGDIGVPHSQHNLKQNQYYNNIILPLLYLML